MMKRGLEASVAAVGLACVAFLVVAQDEPPIDDEGLPGAEAASAIRETLGVGPGDVATAAAGEIGHDGLITLVAAEAAVSDELGALATDYGQAQTELVRCISWGDGIDEAYIALDEARSAMATAGLALMPDLLDDLPAEDRALAERAQANLGIDADLRTLDLGDDQRPAILTAQRERDLVTLNALNWHDEPVLTEAKTTFEASIQSILTAEQSTTLAASRDLLASRMTEMIAAEAAALESTDESDG